jgi:hypothetical protein
MHEHHVTRITRIMWGYTYKDYTDYTDYMDYTDYTDYTDYVGLHAYGFLYEVHEVYETKCGTLNIRYHYLIIPVFPLFARNRFWPTCSSRIRAKIPNTYGNIVTSSTTE